MDHNLFSLSYLLISFIVWWLHVGSFCWWTGLLWLGCRFLSSVQGMTGLDVPAVNRNALAFHKSKAPVAPAAVSSEAAAAQVLLRCSVLRLLRMGSFIPEYCSRSSTRFSSKVFYFPSPCFGSCVDFPHQIHDFFLLCWGFLRFFELLSLVRFAIFLWWHFVRH